MIFHGSILSQFFPARKSGAKKCAARSAQVCPPLPKDDVFFLLPLHRIDNAAKNGYINMIDVTKIREDFPILSHKVYDKPLVYFDNAATTQKPRCVVEAIANEYYSVNANVHRGVHFLSQQATDLHEQARETVRHAGSFR